MPEVTIDIQVMETFQELFLSEISAADDLIRIFASQQNDKEVEEHILSHLHDIREGTKGGGGNNFESVWECISVLLGLRCEYVQLMSKALKSAADKDKEIRQFSEREECLKNRVHELEEKLKEAVTEEDWLDSKEESSLLRDQMSKLNEKFEFISKSNNSNAEEKRRLELENESLLLQIKKLELNATTSTAYLICDTSKTDGKYTPRKVQDQKDTVNLEPQLSTALGYTSSDYSNTDISTVAAFPQKGFESADSDLDLYKFNVDNPPSISMYMKKEDYLSSSNPNSKEFLQENLENNKSSDLNHAASTWVYDDKDEYRTETVSQDMQTFLSSNRRESINFYQQRREESETSFPVDSKPSLCDDDTNRSNYLNKSLRNARLVTAERRKTVTFLDDFECDDEGKKFESSEYIIPERSSNNAFSSAMNRRASVIVD